MILRVNIDNYKSIKSATVDLDMFNVVFGRNGSGKTNFISAIYLLKTLAEGGDLEAILNNRIAPFSSELFYWRDHKNVTRFEFTLGSSDSGTYIFSYEIGFARTSGHFSIQNESLVKVIDGKNINVYKRDRELSYAGEEEALIPFKTEPGKLMLSSYANDDVRAATASIKSCTFVDTALDGKEGVSIIPGNRPALNTIDGIAVSLFIKNGGRFEAAVKSVQKILPDFVAPTIASLDDRKSTSDGTSQSEEEIKRYYVTWGEANLTTAYSQHSLSHGDRRVIHIIFSLFNTDSNAFFAVEEIENGMHYGRITRLLDEFRTQASNRNVQILLTTHSNEILNSILSKEAIQTTKSREDGTRFIRVTDTDEYSLIKEDLKRDPTAAEMLRTGMLQ